MLKVLQWNLNGYINNYSQLQVLIKNHNPKIISLQETHLHSTQNIPIPINYTFYHENTAINGYGGVALLIHNSIQQQIVPTNAPDFDTIAVKVHSKIKFTIISSYIPPSKSFKIQNLRNIYDSLQPPFLITGDFNSWHRSWGSQANNTRGNIIFKFINQSSLITLNNGSPTHFTTHHTFTHIDLSIASPLLSLSSKWYTDNSLSGSDHYPIHIDLFEQNITCPVERPRFNLKKANWPLFQEISEKLSNERFPSSNINKEAANITKIIIQAANETIPQSHKFKIKKTVPWWDQTLQKLKNEKNLCWLTLNRNIDMTNILAYKKANAKLKREIKIRKRTSVQDFTAEISPKSSTLKIWSNINRFFGLKTRHNIYCLTDPNNPTQNILDNNEIANTLSTHWSNSALDNNFPPTFIQQKSNSTHDFSHILSTIALSIEKDITMIEMLASINQLKGTTPGRDRISYPIIKNLNLFNNILNSQVPQQFKVSTVIPIPKPNMDKPSIDSYRPVSLNPCIAKVMDKIISKRLWWLASNGKLLDSHQFGFKKGKSVSDSLAMLDYQITSSLSTKNHASIISLDFAKAFDRVGIHSIMDELKDWKIGPKIAKYIFNFLTNRKISVLANKVYSTSQSLDNGIPQGSPLSVILFVIAYNKLNQIIAKQKNCQFTAYADDYTIIYKLNKKTTNLNIDTLFREILMV